MQLKNIPIKLAELKAEVNKYKLSPEVRAIINFLILLVEILLASKLKNSRNSSVPPSQDPNRVKEKRKTGKSQGGQLGHAGTTLERVDDPDEIIPIEIDRRTLPKGQKFEKLEPEKRQVVDFEVNVIIKEYQAEVLQDKNGVRHIAEFPFGINKAIQFSSAVKANVVYMDNFQFVSLNRIEEQFYDQLNIKISHGSIVNFSVELYRLLKDFELFLKKKLLLEKVLHADETGINVNGDKGWIHTLCSLNYSYLHADLNRGKEAINEMGILNEYKNKLCHDHWAAYFSYWCIHFLCNAHQVRELTYLEEEENQKWAKKMRILLLNTNEEVKKAGGKLNNKRQKIIIRKYRKILQEGESENKLPKKEKGKRGRQKKTKSRNLLERLIKFEQETLAFMKSKDIPFTNNEAERDLRMTKVQQKVAGCFRSIEGAKVFARIRSFINTCKKNEINVSDAIKSVFEGKLSDVIIKIEKFAD